jgi:hypothetical protein
MTKPLVQLFGWDLKSLWLTAHQKLCHALLLAGKLQSAAKIYRHVMVSSDENTKADFLDLSNGKSRVCNVMQAIILTRTSLRFQAKMQRALSYQRRCCPRCERL